MELKNDDMEVDQEFVFEDKIGQLQDQIQKYISTIADSVEYLQKYTGIRLESDVDPACRGQKSAVAASFNNEKSMADSQYEAERK